MLGVLAACGTQDVGLEESSVELLVRDTAVSTSGTEMEATIVSGEAYIVADTRPVATRVSFYIDDMKHEGTPVKVDEEAPFDMVLDTRSLVDGEHTVTALVVHARKRSESTSVVTTTFMVHNAQEDGTPGGDPIDGPEASPDSGWQSVDVNAALPGTTVEGEGTVELQASGADVWGTSDSFRFHYMQVVGDFDLVTKVLSMTEPDSSAKAGLMIRAALAPESRNSFMYASVPSRQRAQYSVRSEDSGLTIGTPSDTDFPMYLRLSRRADVVYGFTSADGVTWHLVSETSISLPETAFVGLAATSRTDADHVVATFETPEFVTLPTPEPDPVTDPEPQPEPEPAPVPSPVPASGGFSLRADSGFDASLLSAEARVWYRRVWAAIENPDAKYSLRGLADSGNLHNYGYDFNQQMSLLIVALRATQDPLLVDLIAELSDRMAGALVTDWFDYSSGSWVTPDDGTAGLRRFLYYKSSDTRFGGKDTQELRALLSHGMIANMAYVLEANRGVSSPAGLDYGARADFWKDYLRNDFEAIWRIRTGKAWPSFPLWTHQISHSFKSQMRWAFYMYKLTGEQPYLEYALEYADTVLRNSFAVDTSGGPAVVWSHRVRTPDYGLQPVAYLRLDYAVEVDLALEGGLEGIDAEYMGMHARTFAHFVLDNGSADMSFDVGGMRDRTGVSLRGGVTATVPTKDPWTGSSLAYARESMSRFVISFFTPVAVFGEAEHILSVSEAVYRSAESDVENPRNLSIPVGMLLATQ